MCLAALLTAVGLPRRRGIYPSARMLCGSPRPTVPSGPLLSPSAMPMVRAPFTRKSHSDVADGLSRVETGGAVPVPGAPAWRPPLVWTNWHVLVKRPANLEALFRSFTPLHSPYISTYKWFPPLRPPPSSGEDVPPPNQSNASESSFNLYTLIVYIAPYPLLICRL